MQDWDKSKALFEVKSLTVQEYDTVWEGAHRTFREDNYYTVLIKPEESVTLAEFAYEAIKMSKAVINYHCSNPKSTQAVETDLTIFDHEHRVYHTSKKSADIIRVDLRSSGDIRMKFTNPTVRSLCGTVITAKKRPVHCFVTCECIECGKFDHRHMNRQEFKGKLDRIGQIQRYIVVISLFRSD